MANTFGPPVAIGAPAVPPHQPYGLFSALTFEPMNDPHTQNGITWEDFRCIAASGLTGYGCYEDVENEGGIGDDLPNIELPYLEAGVLVTAKPMLIHVGVTYSPVGHDLGWAKQQTTALLLAREEEEVERALWTGALGTDGLDDDVTALTSSPVGLADGLAMLEAWSAHTYGSQGIIHMPRALASRAVAAGSAHTKGAGLYANLDTPIVAGTGYPGTVDGQTAAEGTAWLLVSPPLRATRSEVYTTPDSPFQGFDRGINQERAAAERVYVIGWRPCGIGAVKVNLDGITLD